MHLAAAQHLFLADDRDVVLRLAADDAGVAADAGVDVDRHSPLVAFVLELGIQRDRPRRRFVLLVHRLRIPDELVACDRTNEIPPLHQVVILRARERICRADRHDLEAAAEIHRVRRAERVGVEASALRDAAGARSPVPEVHGNRIVGMADDDESGAANRAAFVAQLDDVARNLAVLAALHRRLAADLQPRRRGGARQHGVVPRQLRDRLRQFLEPSVVGEAAVENRWIVPEDQLEVLGGRGRGRPAKAGRYVADIAGPDVPDPALTFLGPNAVSGITPS